MIIIWYRIFFSLIYSSIIVSSLLNQSIFLDSIHQNIHDDTSLDKFYRNILRDVKHHRSVDTVYSSINVTKIRSNDYDEEYIKNSCYETASDLLYAHGYNRTNVQLSINDIQSLLPAILYSIENPGLWILGLIVVIVIKLIHVIIFFIGGDHCLSLTSVSVSKTLSEENGTRDNTKTTIRFPPLIYRLWLGLGFNAFTCGLMLGTIIYHLIPHIYEVPNESFDYIYLFRATIVFFGVYLFFIVEKLLRFRFKIDEINSQLLGGKISFFQSVCVLGYCLLPLLISAFISYFLFYLPFKAILHIIRFLIVMSAFIWTMYASIRFLGQTQQLNRRMLVLYPIFLFYFLVSWLIILRTHSK
ncbi:unnamed protein product [Rotaria sp. Silwood1]|nr:unnamed protein product [Rotaria sp. Silwood1]